MFDLGGVIMDLRRSDCVEAFSGLGMLDADSFFDEYCQQGPFLQMEVGDISPAEFRDAMPLASSTYFKRKSLPFSYCIEVVECPFNKIAK